MRAIICNDTAASEPYSDRTSLTARPGQERREIFLRWTYPRRAVTFGQGQELFCHRKLRRLVAVELKLDRLKVADEGQMELYLRWLEKHEMEPGEGTPIRLILRRQGR